MHKVGPIYLEHQLKRWMRPDAHLFVRPDWRRFVRPEFQHDHPFALYERKYSAEQPRVPAGSPEGGQWTDKPTPSPAVSASETRPIPAVAPWPSNGPPEVPEKRPSTSAERTRITRLVAAFVRGSVGRFIAIAAGAYWLYSERANIISQNDQPKTLEELQDAASSAKEGYHRHHIVEQTSAEQDGFPRSQIDDRENLVRVPTYKHRAISDWYSKKNDGFGGQTPRDYLRGRSWEERREVGLAALRKFGVLKP